MKSDDKEMLLLPHHETMRIGLAADAKMRPAAAVELFTHDALLNRYLETRRFCVGGGTPFSAPPFSKSENFFFLS